MSIDKSTDMKHSFIQRRFRQRSGQSTEHAISRNSVRISQFSKKDVGRNEVPMVSNWYRQEEHEAQNNSLKPLSIEACFADIGGPLSNIYSKYILNI